MTVYHYKGVNQQGKTVQGTQDADNPKQIKASLRKEGIFLTELREAQENKQESFLQRLNHLKLLRPSVPAQDMATATRQLATLIGAGIPLVESLVALVDQIEHQYFKSVWSEVRQRVSEGLSFGNALAEHTLVFSGLYINMVRAGESSGALDVVLNRLADFTESQAQLRSKLRSTMVYPIFIMIVASGVMVILFVFVIPKLAALFEAQKVPLPMVTQLLISFSQFLSHWWYVVFPFIGLIIWGFRRYIDSPRGRPWWDGVVLNMPIFGPVVRMVAIARFCKTLGTLIASGVPILGAFDIVKNVVQNVVLIEVIEITRDSVKEGDTIAAALKRSGQFPPIVTHMIAIGERSGQLEQMLQNIANSYEVQVDASLRAMTSVLEPLMMVIMGIVVAFIILSVLLPMLQLSSLA